MAAEDDAPDFGGEEEEHQEAAGGDALPVVVPASMPAMVPAMVPTLPVVHHGPQVVLPPSAQTVGPPEEESLPPESDGDGWLELLRDGYQRQMREENECEEPPPFHRAMQFAADPSQGPIPKGKYPRQSLNMQLQMLFRLRTGENPVPGSIPVAGGEFKGKEFKGKGKGGKDSFAPGMVGQNNFAPNSFGGKVSHKGGGIRLPGQLVNQAAKALQANQGVLLPGQKAQGKGFGKGGKMGVVLPMRN